MSKNNHHTNGDALVTKNFLKKTIEEAFSAFAHKYIMPLYVDVAQLKKDMAVVKSDIQIIKADIVIIKADIVTIKADIVTIKADIVEMKIDISELKKDMRDVKKTQKKHDIQITALRDAVRVKFATV